jgi:hypothetical protein
VRIGIVLPAVIVVGTVFMMPIGDIDTPTAIAFETATPSFLV